MTSFRATPRSLAMRRGLRDDWALSFGPRWTVDVTVMALVVFCFGAVRPLSDPDLPMHLAVGEWIVHHGAVPFVEPFAWTREGAAYFAYSWLPDTVFFTVLNRFGHIGLRCLQGVIVLASVGSVLVLARAAAWRASQGVILAGMSLIVSSFFVATLRPQSVLLVTIPLIWAGFLRIVRGEDVAASAALLFVSSAMTANSHLFFPVTLAPAVLTIVYRPARRRDAVLGVGGVIAGWFTSPYSMHWLAVFRHNFGPNPLIGPPAAITELQPGFVAMLHPTISALFALVAAMIAVAWILPKASLSRSELLMAFVYWTLGLILFGYAARLFVLWWLLAIVPCGWTVVHLTRETEEAAPRLRFRLLGLFACALILAIAFGKTRREWQLEGDAVRRTLPTSGAVASEPLAIWLERHVNAPAPTRLMTSFANGSYLTWRLPGYSASIDSRGIFPDTVAGAEAVVLATDRDVPLGPWQSADVAILPVRFRVAETLDSASAWQRMASAPGYDEARDSVALWIRRTWWESHRRSSDRSP